MTKQNSLEFLSPSAIYFGDSLPRNKILCGSNDYLSSREGGRCVFLRSAGRSGAIWEHGLEESRFYNRDLP